MITVRVLDVKPHPDQATNNPGCWAVKFRVSREGGAPYGSGSRTFWRWYNRHETVNGVYVTPSNKKPSADEIITDFWDNTFAELHGFNFERSSASSPEREKARGNEETP